MDDFHRLIDVVMEGDFRSGSAWGGSHIGWCYGGKTIQGVLPYYYSHISAPNRSLTLNRCIHNTMADTPDCVYVDAALVLCDNNDLE